MPRQPVDPYDHRVSDMEAAAKAISKAGYRDVTLVEVVFTTPAEPQRRLLRYGVLDASGVLVAVVEKSSDGTPLVGAVQEQWRSGYEIGAQVELPAVRQRKLTSQ